MNLTIDEITKKNKPVDINKILRLFLKKMDFRTQYDYELSKLSSVHSFEWWSKKQKSEYVNMFAFYISDLEMSPKNIKETKKKIEEKISDLLVEIMTKELIRREIKI